MAVDFPGHEWLPAVWNCGEIDSPQYDTAGRLTMRSFKLWGDLLGAVSYCGEIYSAQYRIILRGDLLGPLSYCWEIQKNSNNSAKSWPKSNFFYLLVSGSGPVRVMKKWGSKIEFGSGSRILAQFSGSRVILSILKEKLKIILDKKKLCTFFKLK